MQNEHKPEGNKSAASSPLDRYSVQPASKPDDSPFYKSSAPSITLPKGGGAIKGIDEKFSVNGVNGTAGLEIPLPLSPGRGGFTPSLSLSYNSGSGNSEFGLGFGLGLPSIQRRTDKQLPLYNDASESDVFLLAGAEDLVPAYDSAGHPAIQTVNSYTIKEYRPRIEGLFARIEYIKKVGSGIGWWRVTTKDNITTYYGLTAEGRIADPSDATRIFKWLPQLTLDHKGNVQQYVYAIDNHSNTAGIDPAVFEKNRLNGLAPYTNTYLKHALYCNQVPYFIDPDMASPTGGAYIRETDIYAPTLANTFTSLGVIFLMEAVMDYGDHDDYYDKNNPSVPLTVPVPPCEKGNVPWPGRKDAFSSFHAGFEIRTYRKCRRVLMFHHFYELEGKDLVRTLELTYQNDGSTGLAEADFIASAKQVGYSYDNNVWHSKSLPAMTFAYQPLCWDKKINAVSKEDFRNAPQGLTGPYQWMDFEGEGIPGIFTEQAGGWFYKNNLGNGHFDTAKSIATKPNFKGLGSGALQWQDLDADGRRQVVSQSPKGFWELDDDQRWRPFRTFSKNLNIDWNSPFTKMLDLNGDGRGDVLITEDRAWTWYENLGTGGFDTGGNAPNFLDEEKGPMLLLRDTVQSIFLADINGDGMTDLVRIKNGEICYWPNMGYGKFGAKVTMADAPVFQSPDIYNPLYLSFADISGTGAADLIYVGKNKCTAWINYAGNGWSDPIDINPLPGTDAMSKISVIDFLGNGTGCIVWSSPLPKYATAPLQYIDLMGGHKPYLMKSYSNGMGKSVSVTYKSSTQFYLEDKQAGKPWITKLPFPVHCIDSVTTADSVSETSYTQTYRYRHGYYDHEEREFRGFGYTESIDIDHAIAATHECLDQFPVLTKTWNHTGAWLREQSLLDQYKKEYFPLSNWDGVATIASFPDQANMNAQEWREAHRALKGSPLRQEVYAMDGDLLLQNIPYSVTATTYVVKQVQHLWDNRYASYLTYSEQSIAFSCERNMADARIAHQLTLAIDAYGNVLKSASVAYPRLYLDPDYHLDLDTSLPQQVQDAQKLMHISYSENNFTNDVITDKNYRLRVGCESKSYEILGLDPDAPRTGLWTVDTLTTLLNPAAEVDFSVTTATGVKKRKLSHSRVLFKDDDAATILAQGSLSALAIPHEQYHLAYSDAVRVNCYGSNVDAGMLTEGGYFTDQDSNGNNYWLRSGTAVYTNPLTKFFTPEVFRDPWGNTTTVQFWDYYQNSTSTYINYWLLPKATIDAKFNTTTVRSYNMRLLQPKSMADINNNVSDILYDALGMPVAMAMRGKVNGSDVSTEGDVLTGLDPNDAGDIANQAAFFNASIATSPTDNATALLKNATWRCVYDFSKTPVAVGMIACQHHYYPSQTRSSADCIVRISYSDGMGRVLMHKAQAQPDTAMPVKWVGSGRTIYNNKGNAVMQYEPYFSATFACETAELITNIGVSPRIHYDALGRVYRTDLPDGSYTKTTWTPWMQTTWDNNDTVIGSDWYTAKSALVVPGIPQGGETAAQKETRLDIIAQKDAATKAAAHNETPTVVHTDTLARAFYTIQTPDALNSSQQIHSYVDLDVLGNRLAVYAIPSGSGYYGGSFKRVLTYKYNMIKQVCQQSSVDSGSGMTFVDAAGQPLYAWDAMNTKFRMEYDSLRRVTRKWAGTKLLELMFYGDSNTLTLPNPDYSGTGTLPPANFEHPIAFYGDTAAASFTPETLNLRGQLYDHYDGSGRIWILDGYDFKGNPKRTSQRLLADKTATDTDWATAWQTLIQSGAANTASTFTNWSGFQSLLYVNGSGQPEIWHASVTVDALNRPMTSTDQGGNITRNTYDKGGALNGVYLTPAPTTANPTPLETTYVSNIQYDAKGQRSAIYYKDNTIKTAYTYDPQTYRLTRLLTTGSTGTVLFQDLNYYYDPVGNITQIRDNAQPVTFCSNTAVDSAQRFTYDALYRLIIATGREQPNATDFGPDDNNNDAAYLANTLSANTAQNYTQTYTYDAVGNIMKLQHRAAAGSYTRNYAYDANSNRLFKVTADNNPANFPPVVPPTPPVAFNRTYDYGYVTPANNYDARGNMLRMPHLSTMAWNTSNELYSVTNGSSMVANYQYSGGQRIRKYVVKGSTKEERIYFGSFEIYRRFDSSSLTPAIERSTVHVHDDTGRIAMLEQRNTAYGDDGSLATLIRYVFSNHLQSASLELDNNNNIITYEEYHPYGTTAFQAKSASIAAVAKRYRYTGKERDEESGLYYHGARYYVPWLGRWTASDPMESKYAGMSPYNYSFNNPVRWNDLNGADPTDPPKQSTPNAMDDIIQKGEAITDNNGKALLNADGTVMKASQDELTITSIPFVKSVGGNVISALYNELYETAKEKHGTVAASFSATGSYGVSLGGGVGLAVDYKGNFGVFYNVALNALNSDAPITTNKEASLKSGGSLMFNYSVYKNKEVIQMSGAGFSIGGSVSDGLAVGASEDYSTDAAGNTHMGYTLSGGIGTPGESVGVTINATYMAAFSKADFRELFVNSWDGIGVRHMQRMDDATNNGNLAAPIGLWNYDGSRLIYKPVAPLEGTQTSYSVSVFQRFHMNTTGFSPKGMTDRRGDRTLELGIIMNKINKYLFVSENLIPKNEK